MKRKTVVWLFSILFLFYGTYSLAVEKMSLSSPVFKYGNKIPQKYTCDGEDISPPLKWDGVPKGTKSFAIICDDPDAPMGVWSHWVYYNIPKNIRELPENILPVENPEIGGTQGINDFKKTGYSGPCPPFGTHRYFFRIFALDDDLDLPSGLTRKELLHIIEGHVLSQAVLMGTYSR